MRTVFAGAQAPGQKSPGKRYFEGEEVIDLTDPEQAKLFGGFTNMGPGGPNPLAHGPAFGSNTQIIQG